MEKKFKVLVVDDEPDKRLLLAFALENDGYEVFTAEDGVEGLAAVETRQPDLIVTDVMMPRMDGYEMTRRVRSNPQTKFIPVIIQNAARAGAPDVRLGSELGAMGYLTDPTDLDLLRVRARTLLDLKGHMDDLQARADSKATAYSLISQFDFPEEVRVPCEQYLLYFVQFLKDLGVEATADISHEAGKVLFAVTPSDKNEALGTIHNALEVYLRLAASPIDSSSMLHSDIQVQRLAANIQHLQGQLTLAHAVLQAKDATIELQQTTIQQQRLLTGEIVLESMKDVSPKSKDKDTEEVLGGLAEITRYEGKGFNLNLPEAFRRLRKLFNERKGSKE
jgi:CheY-like chemotaxis protein